MSDQVVNLAALAPLYRPDEEPNRHRVRAEREGEPAKVEAGRRRTTIAIAQNLRSVVRAWRETDYAGASDTTRELLHHWFLRDHIITTEDGFQFPFRYYFCQREAIETLIYVNEVRQIGTLSGLVGEFAGEEADTMARGVNPDDDRWAKYAFKLATGTGKTKVMSLAIVWSYFHSLKEPDSTMARHFVVIAPNLTVFERLKDDFKPSRGGGDIFDNDPLIPPAWRDEWNLTTVLQKESSGASTGGTLYLTNIHQLYAKPSGRTSQTEMYEWMGPNVSKAKALDTGEALRSRIMGHQRVMVLNDEAHHLWDSENAWNEAIATLHQGMEERGGGLVAQLDFSATPKDNAGRIFQHVVCDTPLGEAVDAGIVKTPIIGKGRKWAPKASSDASEVYHEQLIVGYERYKKSLAEWEKSGKKPLLFVMTESTEEADQITNRLNTDPRYEVLNSKTINLHTNLKGKVKKVGGRNGHLEFVESEKDISDEDLKALRELSRQIDSDSNPYRCIVSVLMLREGWDVRNVTTIVPLRPFTAASNILPEQTLGRGLRRMTPAGSDFAVAEVVTVVEHPAFTSLYQEQLSQQGLQIEAVEIEDIPRTTVTVFPDKENKDIDTLDIELPSMSAGYLRTPKVEITIDDVRQSFSKYRRLKLGTPRDETINYEGRNLFTNEVIERMQIKLPLLQNPIGALNYFLSELEHMIGIGHLHKTVFPLLEDFVTKILFEEEVDLFDPRLLARLSSQDVREHIRATFVPLLQKRTTHISKRESSGDARKVSGWKPFQVTHSATQPAIPAAKTLFNLVPCNRTLEETMARTLDTLDDVEAFCKNAGPQCLRIDYLTDKSRLSLYTPDFLVRLADGTHLVVETKGRVDKDVPLKASAAVSWCEAASSEQCKWEYLYVPEAVFQQFSDSTLVELQGACATHLADLLEEHVSPQFTLPFGDAVADTVDIAEFIEWSKFDELPPRYQKGITQALSIFGFLKTKSGSFAPSFNSLLGPIDEAARGLMIDVLSSDVPENADEVNSYFSPDLSAVTDKTEFETLRRKCYELRQTIVDKKGSMPIGVLRWSLNYAKSDRPEFDGIIATVKNRFGPIATPGFVKLIKSINAFRNNYIAHQEMELDDVEEAKTGLAEWLNGLYQIWKAHN